ncbi:MAG: aminodeoxychorismate synthase component I [Candidatus Omnitrophota bacterium]
MKNTFLFYDTSPGAASRQVLLFQDPVDMIVCHEKSDIARALDHLDKAIMEGYYAAGFLSYELGSYFQEIPLEKTSSFPLLCFGIFSSAKKIPFDRLEDLFHDPKNTQTFEISEGHYSVPRDIYYSDLNHIREHIKDGNTYQVNYTFKYKFGFKGSPRQLFNSLRRTQDVPYAGFIDLDRWSVISLSPELFFRKEGEELTVRPMKGTIKRGKTNKEDNLNRNNLSRSPKNRAENIMIVDLLRNDLGRISETGSVMPAELFSIEKYRTLFQMTSTIRSRLKKDINWGEIFKNIFPSGSVTGAPKKRTMEIIAETEKEPRDIYTGSIGFITPEGDAQFNVAIRTLLIDKNTGAGAMGIGSGIVYDSVPEKEYNESILKGSFLTNPDLSPEFGLIETILWENGEYFLLALHMERLRKSARYFSFPLDEDAALLTLEKTSSFFDRTKRYRVRLVIEKTGEVDISSDPLDPPSGSPVKVTISDKKMDKENLFLYHKTTNRKIYDAELARYKKKGFFDCIFLNSEDEITEGAITNIVIREGKNYWTPAVSSGLLAGVYREHLLRIRKIPLKEKVLRMEDLLKADDIFLINSVRKMVPAELEY